MKAIGRVKIHPSSVIFAAVLVLLNGSTLCLVPFAAALSHELGHLIMMRLCSCRADSFELTLFGAEISAVMWNLGTLRAVAVYAAGAAANLISAACVTALFTHTAAAELFTACSISLAAVNMLPIRSLDGGCIVEAILYKISPLHAHTVLSAISAVTIVILWLVSVYLILLFNANISLLIFCIYLFATLFLRRE